MIAVSQIHGVRAHFFDQVTTTFACMEDILCADPHFQGPQAVFANSQSEGVGRRGRGWHSPEGNFYMTLALPMAEKSRDLSTFSLVSAIGVCECLREFIDIESGVKWPNDVYVHDAKMAGILLQSAANGVMVGIGINIVDDPAYKIVPYQVTYVNAHRATPIDLQDLRLAILSKMVDYWQQWQSAGLEQFYDLWMRLDGRIGKPIKVMQGEREQSGIYQGISRQGALLLQQEHGTIEIIAGEVV